jgi:glycosyltransferase involved in cell wall biosynthesis
MFKLSICIAGMSHRPKPFIELIKKNAPDWVEFIIDDRDDISIGAKRKCMIDRCKGDYIAMLDDDDDITDSYFYEVLKGIEKGVDVICLKRVLYIDGKINAVIAHGVSNPYLEGCQSALAGHFCPVKRDIVTKVNYCDAGRHEDSNHIERLVPYLKTAYYVPIPTYIQYFKNILKEYDRHRTAEVVQINEMPLV